MIYTLKKIISFFFLFFSPPPPPPPRARFHNTCKPETLFPLFIVLAPGPFTCIAGAQEVLLKWREGVGWGGIDEQRKIFPWKC